MKKELLKEKLQTMFSDAVGEGDGFTRESQSENRQYLLQLFSSLLDQLIIEIDKSTPTPRSELLTIKVQKHEGRNPNGISWSFYKASLEGINTFTDPICAEDKDRDKAIVKLISRYPDLFNLKIVDN